MARMHNVDLGTVESFRKKLEDDPAQGKKTQVIEGEWVTEGEGPQFRALLRYEQGERVLEMDGPTFMGGGGSMPGPLHYCFYGLAACYTGVFAMVAAQMGIRIRKLSARLEADVNFASVYGIGEAPPMEGIRATLTVESDAPEDKIRAAEELALARCPAVYTMRNRVPFAPRIEIRRSAA